MSGKPKGEMSIIQKRKVTKGQKTFDKIYDQLEPRLDKLGEITVGEAFDLAGNPPYYTFVKVFKDIMGSMVELGKAEWVSKGVYRIIKANTPKHDNQKRTHAMDFSFYTGNSTGTPTMRRGPEIGRLV